MENNEILAAAQQDREKGKEYEYRVENRAFLLSYGCVLFVALVILLVETFVKGIFNPGVIFICGTGIAVFALYKGFSFKKIGWIIGGVIFGAFAIMCLLMWVVML